MARPAEGTLLAALVLVQVAFGGLAVAGKVVLGHVPPLGLAFARAACAAVVLVALERILVRSPMPPWRDLGRFALFALLGVALNQALYLSGLQLTTATDAILLIATIPAFTLLAAVVARQERASALKVVGLGVSFVGVAVLVLGSGFSLGSRALLGDALVLLNSLSYSLYLVASRPVLERYDPLTLVAWVFVLGTLQLALLGAPALVAVDWAALPPSAWVGFAYALLLGTVVTYGLNAWVLRHMTASHVASFVYLQPVVGALAAAWLLGEALTWRVGLAGALILAGVALATQAASRARRAANPSH